ncbi:hypothetical protein F4678DRAFT_239220 [Xylaria arbuscula]|nr:hypothetical protein F4678DRAFT_239220 [Xylaria arbuscula]
MRRPSRYRAPTWSWASANSRVKYWTETELMPLPRHYMLPARERSHSEGDLLFQRHGLRPSSDDNPNPSARALEVCVKTEEGNPFGQVLSGIIFVEGILRSGKVRDDRAPLPISVLSETESDGPRFTVEIFMSNYAKVPSVVVPFYADYVLNDGVGSPTFAPTVYLLTLCPGIGLVLEKTPLNLKDCYVYRRIGILRLSFEFHEAYGISLTAGRQIRLGVI